MPLPMGGPPAMQGLSSAAPNSPDPLSQDQDPKELMQTAAMLLMEIASKFGPEILNVMKQLLSGPEESGEPNDQASMSMKEGMM